MFSIRAAVVVTALIGTAGSVQAQSSDTLLQQMRKEYADAQRTLPTLRTVRRDLNDEANEGGTVVGYYTKTNTLSAMTVTLFGETGKRVDEVYWLPGNHVFVLRSVMRYDKPFGKVISTRQSRFYLSDGKLVRHLEGPRSLATTGAVAAKLTQEVKKDMDRYKSALAKPNPY